MTNLMNETMLELAPEEMTMVNGGTSSYEAFLVYMEYVNTLYDKYDCFEMGLAYLKKQCTSEEKARIRELWHDVKYADDVIGA